MSRTRKTNAAHILHFQMFLIVQCLALHKHQQWEIEISKTKNQSTGKQSVEKKLFSGIYCVFLK